MIDNVERLRNSPELQQLLVHYADLGDDNPEAWHPRPTRLESENLDLIKLHGELMALDFIEQNTGHTPCSYRLTRAGVKALRVIEEPDILEMVSQAA